MSWIWEQPAWPAFTWDSDALDGRVLAVHQQHGRLVGRMESLGFTLQAEAELQSLTQTVLKSSEIEGEHLPPDQVRSSIAKHLRMDIAGAPQADRYVAGVVDMMWDATQRFDEPLTAERLFAWHSLLFPDGPRPFGPYTVGAWRDDREGPMRVTSGAIGRERIHFQAPPAAQIDREMRKFLSWCNLPRWPNLILGSGIAHLWFVTIHPFDDGNGRIARAIADLVLSKVDYSPRRFYSMSNQIRGERNAYYQVLEEAQRGGLDITPWLAWFLGCLERAIQGADTLLSGVIDKARFWQQRSGEPFNDRQRKVLNRLLDGFDGNLTSSRWANLTRCSQDTALRDIENLMSRGILVRNPGGGRSTSYALARQP